MAVRGALAFLLTALLGLQVLGVPVLAQNETQCPDGETPDASGACGSDDPPEEPLPDLVAAAISIDRHDLREGDVVLLWADLRNDGAAEASFDVAFLIDGAEQRRVPGHLAPGADLRLEADWAAVAGTHSFAYAIDPDGAVTEASRSNNRLETSIVVATHDEPEAGAAAAWIECRDGTEWEIQEHSDGTRTETDLGRPCGGQDRWIVNEWCDASGQWQVEYEYSDGRRELVVEGPCGDDVPPYPEDGREPYPEDGREPYPPHEDPYGCDAAAGQWWDHYLARCVSEAEWQLQDAFFRCTDEAHRSMAQDQKAQDIAMREQRLERRDREMQAMDLERQGRFDEARDIWEELRRLDWEEQKSFHESEQRIAAAVNGCIDEYSQKARANGWAYLVEEFEMQRFHAAPPMPMPGPGGPGPGGFDCPPPEAMRRHDGDGGGFQEPMRGDMPPPPPGGPGPGGDPCGPHGGPPLDIGLPPEAMEAMEEARAWCEEQRWDIESRMFAAETFDEAMQLEDEIRLVERQCRERMEKVFREHDRGFEDEFDRHFGAFSMTETSTGIDVRGANTWFTGLPEQMRVADFTCRGAATLSLVQPYFDIDDVYPVAEHKLGFFAGDSERPFIVVHDDPHCTVGIKPGNAGVEAAEVKVQLSSLYTCERNGHIECSDGQGTTISVLVHGEEPVLVDERTLIVRGAVDIRLAGGAGELEGLEQYQGEEDFDGTAAVRIKDGKVVAQAVALGDMEMAVSAGDDEDTLKVSLSKASHVGSFVVLALEKSVFGTCQVDVHGWDTTGGARDELELREAEDLSDALDADYDGDWVKFYAVEDKHGCQVILTNGHYSEKEFVLQADGAARDGINVPAPGLVAVVASLGGVAVAVRAWTRRRP